MQQFLPNIYNFTPQNMFNTRVGLSKVRSNSANARILCIGDSTTFGAYSNAGSDSGDLISNAYPAQLSNILRAAGINSHANSFYGLGSNTFENRVTTSADPRITLGSGWAVAPSSGGSAPCPGGTEINGSKSAAGNATFTPTEPVDTFQVFCGKSTVAGQLGIQIGSGSITTLNLNGSSPPVISGTITGVLGINTFNLVPQAGTGTFYDVFGISSWNSGQKWVDVMNCGWPGANSGNVAGITFGTLGNHFTAIAPNLVILNHGINDAIASPGETLANYKSFMQTIITAVLGSGSDCVLASPNPIGSGTSVPLSSYASVMYQLAETNNIPFIDTFTRWGGSETAYGTSGMMGTSQSTHPNQSGYADIASGISKLILAL